MCMSVLPECALYDGCVQYLKRAEGALSPWGLALQMAMSGLVVLGTKPGASGRATALNHRSSPWSVDPEYSFHGGMCVSNSSTSPCTIIYS